MTRSHGQAGRHKASGCAALLSSAYDYVLVYITTGFGVRTPVAAEAFGELAVALAQLYGTERRTDQSCG